MNYVLLVHNPFNWKRPLRYVSFLIRYFTKNYWNHNSFMVIKNGEILIYESDIDGVKVKPFNKEWASDKIIRVCEVKKDLYPSKREERALSKVGKKYDFQSLLIHHLVYIYLGIWIGRKEPKAGDKFTCSEYVGYIYASPSQDFGDIFPDWWKIRPVDFDNHRRLRPKFEGKAVDFLETIRNQTGV